MFNSHPGLQPATRAPAGDEVSGPDPVQDKRTAWSKRVEPEPSVRTSHVAPQVPFVPRLDYQNSTHTNTTGPVTSKTEDRAGEAETA
jgi:hypothetical protein